MHAPEQSRFDALYQKHLIALKLHGHAVKTIEAYSRAIRRLAQCLHRCPDDVTKDELESHFAPLLETHSWSTIKLDRNGIRFFFENVLDKKLPWLDLIKAPKTQRLPDVLTQAEIATIIRATRRFDFQCFWFVTYSLGLRLSETLNLEVGDIDAQRQHVHVRHGKGAKDRFVILPAMTLAVLRKLWCSHKHPRLLFPRTTASRWRASTQSYGPWQRPEGLQTCRCRCRYPQTRLHPFPAPQLRNPHDRIRAQPARRAGTTRPWMPQNDGPICAHYREIDRRCPNVDRWPHRRTRRGAPAHP